MRSPACCLLPPRPGCMPCLPRRPRPRPLPLINCPPAGTPGLRNTSSTELMHACMATAACSIIMQQHSQKMLKPHMQRHGTPMATHTTYPPASATSKQQASTGLSSLPASPREPCSPEPRCCCAASRAAAGGASSSESRASALASLPWGRLLGEEAALPSAACFFPLLFVGTVSHSSSASCLTQICLIT